MNSDTGMVSDSLGGTSQPTGGSSFQDQPQDQFQSRDQGQDNGIAAGYGNNVDKADYGNDDGTGEKKQGFMSKIKDKLRPDGPGKTDFGNDQTATAAAHVNDAYEGAGQGFDLNRE